LFNIQQFKQEFSTRLEVAVNPKALINKLHEVREKAATVNYYTDNLILSYQSEENGTSDYAFQT
jgi:hypothetical protein